MLAINTQRIIERDAVDIIREWSSARVVRPSAASRVESYRTASRAEPSGAETIGLARLQVVEPLAYCRRARHVTRVRANEGNRRTLGEEKDEWTRGLQLEDVDEVWKSYALATQRFSW